jgi:ribose 5-phosphate isomerase A
MTGLACYWQRESNAPRKSGTLGQKSRMNRELKAAAANAAMSHLRDGMRIGIGTGSTAEEFILLLAERVRAGLEIVGVPTSERTAALCDEMAIPLTTLDETPRLDIAIDGADEIGPDLALIKGGGGALLREKIVAAASREFIVIADRSKVVPVIGTFGVPIEVNRFGLESTRLAIADLANSLGLESRLKIRLDGRQPFVTDGGHLIVHASFGLIHDAGALDKGLLAIPGVVQHGLFLGMAMRAYIASEAGVEVIAL